MKWLVVLLLAFVPLAAQAQYCQQQVVGYGQAVAVKSYAVQSYVQPQVVYQQVYQPAYQVGYSLQAQAVIQQEKAADKDYQAFQKFKEYQQYQRLQQIYGQQQQQHGGYGQQHAPPTVPGALRQHCASCHGLATPTPAGGLYFDSGHPLRCEDVVLALKLLGGKVSPPAKMAAMLRSLTPADKGALMDEMLDLQSDSPPPQTPPSSPLPPDPAVSGI